MDHVIGFFEWLFDFLKDNGLFIVVGILAVVLIVFLFESIIPEGEDIEDINNLKDNCEIVALGQYNDTVSGFRLQRCIVPDGVCYVSSAGGVDCKWSENEN